MPYIVMMQMFGAPLTTSFQGPNALQEARFRFSCFGAPYKQAKTLAKYVKYALNGCYGPLSTGNAEVQDSWIESEVDDAEPIPRGTLYSTHIDVRFIFVDTDT
jgi:hypothetical protein